MCVQYHSEYKVLIDFIAHWDFKIDVSDWVFLEESPARW